MFALVRLLVLCVFFPLGCDGNAPDDVPLPPSEEVVTPDDTDGDANDEDTSGDDVTPPPADDPPLPDDASPESRFMDVSATHLSGGALQGPSMDAKPADLDGDGDLDLVIANEFAANLLLLNDGTGRFTDASARLPRDVHDSEDIGIADFDSDGDLDIVLVSEDDQTNELYLNNGDGTFEKGSLPVAGTSNGVFVEDINGDSHPDILIGNAGANVILINDGTGQFTDESSQRLPTQNDITQDLEMGDVDGDGDLDLLVGNENTNRLLLNDGTGVFSNAPSGSLPIPSGGEETREADFGDADGDGDLDIFFANVGWSGINPQNRLLLNDGTGRFTDATSTHFPSNTDTTLDGDFVDLDEDGDLDIVTANVAFGTNQLVDARVRAFINDGTGRFTDETEAIFPETAWSRGLDIEASDFNGDGRVDLYVCSRQGRDLLLLMR